MRLLIEHSLRLDGGSETIDGRLVDPPAEVVKRVPILVETLHDAHRAAVDRGTEESGHRRIPLVFKRQGQRRKPPFAIPLETRIKIFKSDALLQRTNSETHRALAQLAHEIDVADFKQPQRTGIGREAAAVVHHARLLLFDVDDHVAAFETSARFPSRLGANDHLAISVGEIKLALAVGDSI